MDIQLFPSDCPVASLQHFEYVERKGLGHPDSICDSVMEAAANALHREYQQRCGRVLHYNLDKALLVAGQSEPGFGGGRILSPMEIIAGDRAINQLGEVNIPVDEIVESAVFDWFQEKLRFVKPGTDLQFFSKIKPGSVELAGIFDLEQPIANDTSVAVGYAPLTETERIVLAVERHLNSPTFKNQFPAAGEDVKVMAARHENRVKLTLAVAMVDRFVASATDYFEQTDAIRTAARRYVQSTLNTIEDVDVAINMLDDPTRGPAGMYLTVAGTSAENGDSGEVGRGNGVNGIISMNRPTTNEALAGKNSTCHVGKIYNRLSHQIAGKIVSSIEPVQESYVWLCSQIGRPVIDPWSTAVTVTLDPGIGCDDIREQVDEIVQTELARAVSTH